MIPRALVAVAAFLLSTAAPAGAHTRIAELWGGSSVRAQGSLAVWSAYDIERDEFRLVLRRGRVVQTLPVKPRDVPFDVDLGTDTRGRPELAYSRCSVESGTGGSADQLRRGCDLRVLRLSGRLVERRVRNAVSADGEEVEPTLWYGRIVWERRREGRRPQVLTRPLMARRDVVTEVRGALLPGRGVHVEALELRGRQLAVVSRGDPPDGAGLSQTALRLVVLGGPRRTVKHTIAGLGGQTLLGPSFADGWLGWYLACPGDPGGCVRGGGPWRYSPATGHYESAKDARAIDGYALRPDGRPLVVGSGGRERCIQPADGEGDVLGDTPGCEVSIGEPPSYVPRP
jgi:hypothetical protein